LGKQGSAKKRFRCTIKMWHGKVAFWLRGSGKDLPVGKSKDLGEEKWESGSAAKKKIVICEMGALKQTEGKMKLKPPEVR